jgi:outer membrane usher protein
MFAGTSTLTAFSAAHAEQPGATLQNQERRVTMTNGEDPQAQSQTPLNPTGKAIVLTVPAKDGGTYLGDIALTIMPDDRIEFSAQRALDLLSNLLNPEIYATLQANFSGKANLTPADFEASGVGFRYNPQTLEFNLIIASERRVSKSVQVSPLDRTRLGSVSAPARASAYVNIRGTSDYIHAGGNEGFAEPVLFLDGAARLGGIVAESEGSWQPGARGVDFQRLGSRLVVDDQENLVRWTAGDLQPVARNFQSSPDIAGISLFRSYSVLQPQQIIRPRGDRSFKLDRPSTVEVQVNGQTVRRLQLNPGTFDLRDFPFTQGANDIRLTVLDDSGRSEILRFNVFLDQSQLAKGLSEFGFYAGVKSPLGLSGPRYSDDLAFTGFYRRGISDRVTVGINAQADKIVKMGGGEAVFGTSFGTIAGSFSLSDIDRFGTGRASVLTFQRLIQRRGGQADSLNIFAESRSRNFASLGTLTPSNPFKYEVGGGYSRAFSDAVYGGFDGRFSKGRDGQRDVQSYRATAGWRLSSTASFTADARYERDNRGTRVGGLLSLTVRLGRYSSVRTDYDSRDNRARASFQTLKGQGVGSYNITADVERSDRGSGVNFNGNYFANRAELGISHFGTFEPDFGGRTSERTSFRFGTSLAIADGAVSVGRPIFDSFAIVKPHKSLKDTDIVIEPSQFGFTANSSNQRAATHPSISSYSERTITVDAPGARAGTDLGQGSFRLFPPYRSGYRLEVGSAYSVTAIGRMVDVDGEAVALITGTATEIAHPERPKTTVFTNRDGRFGASGLAPGKWRLEMLDAKKSQFEFTIPENADGIVRLGDISPVKGP